MSTTERPAVFIGSSNEGLGVAQAMQLLLDQDFEVELWSQGAFGLGQGALESLVAAVQRSDFAVLVLSADDLVVSRGEKRPAARDNVLFELGLFIGGLGRERTFMVFDRKSPPNLPSDLAGITAATFEQHTSGNLEAALGAASTRLRSTMRAVGSREVRRTRELVKAAESIQDAETQMRALITLLARSRKVELDIISAQFGPLIAKSKLSEIQRDLADLQQVLSTTS